MFTAHHLALGTWQRIQHRSAQNANRGNDGEPYAAVLVEFFFLLQGCDCETTPCALAFGLLPQRALLDE